MPITCNMWHFIENISQFAKGKKVSYEYWEGWGKIVKVHKNATPYHLIPKDLNNY